MIEEDGFLACNLIILWARGEIFAYYIYARNIILINSNRIPGLPCKFINKTDWQQKRYFAVAAAAAVVELCITMCLLGRIWLIPVFAIK